MANFKREIIAITNQKGGTGKTTTAAGIGYRLYCMGFKVLLIDLDAQGNLTYTVNADSSGGGIFGAMEQPQTAAANIQEITAENAAGGKIDILPSTERLAVADKVFTETGKEYKLKEAIQGIADKYQFIIIDTPPALGTLSINALATADSVIIPAQADIYSLQGVSQISNTIATVRKYCNPKLTISGILLTRHNSRTTISRDLAAAFSQTAEKLNTRVYNTHIRECTAIKEAQALRRDIFDYAPKSNAAADYYDLVNEIIENIEEKLK